MFLSETAKKLMSIWPFIKVYIYNQLFIIS